MQETLERERKLDVDGEFSLPELPGSELGSRLFTSTYHDTPVRSLSRAGITLRRRLENGKSVWQLKLPRPGKGMVRAELEAAGGPSGPPASLRRLLPAHLRHGELEPVATLRTRRSGVRVADGDRHLADVTVDAVEILDAGHAAGGFTEIEVELADGEERDLDRLEKRLKRAGAKRGAGTPKLMRVLTVPEPVDPSPEAPLGSRLRHYLERQLAELEARDPGVRLGTDAEDVHKFRVATRRTRALIRVTRPLLGERLAALEAELRWLAGVLGPVRDLDVLVAHLAEEAALLDVDEQAARALVAGLEAERETCRARLLAALESPRYLEVLTSFAAALPVVESLSDGDPVDVARDAVRKLRKTAADLPETPSDEELHALRKSAKRARYAAELAAVGGSEPAARTADAFKHLQDVVGEHQDAVVAEEHLRALARARTAVAAGRLIDRERARKRRMRETYPDALAAALRAAKKSFD
jgi:CHAD domain-containing protein/adenylate cyclase class IV